MILFSNPYSHKFIGSLVLVLVLLSPVASFGKDSIELARAEAASGNITKAKSIATRLAKKGSAEADLLLGKIALFEDRNDELAFKNFSKAATKLNSEAMLLVGRWKLVGRGTREDKPGGIKLLREAVKRGNLDANFYLAFALRLNPGLAEGDWEIIRLSIDLLSSDKDKQSLEYLGSAFLLGDAWKSSSDSTEKEISNRAFITVLRSQSTDETISFFKSEILDFEERGLSKVSKGDGSNSDKTCQSLGFKVWDQSYLQCKNEVSLALAKREREIEVYNLRVEQYRLAKEAYDEQMRAIEEEKKDRRNMAMLQYGLNLMSGTSPYASRNFERASREYLGLPPAPEPPPIQPFLVTAPNGRVSCTVSAGVVSCR